MFSEHAGFDLAKRRYFVTPMIERLHDQIKFKANGLSRDKNIAKTQISEMRKLLTAYEQELRRK